MKPILYAPEEKEYKTNGIGRLSDAISCTVTEERNGQYELHMVYPQNGIHFADIKNGCQIFCVPADNRDCQPFRIYRISKPLSGKVEIDAEHISYQMCHIPVMPFANVDTYLDSAMALIKRNTAEDNPFTLTNSGNQFYSSRAFSMPQPDNLRAILFGQQGSLLDLYGGEWEFDRYTVKLWKNRGADHGVTIRYGKNLTDINQEENIQTTYTGVCPFWKGTQEETNADVVVTLPEKVLHSEKAENFPYQRTKIVDFSSEFQEKPTVEQLRTRAQRYINENDVGKPKVSLTVSFVALHQTQEYSDMTMIDHINLCDTVTVEFPELGVSTKAKVIRTEYDVLMDRYESIDIGEAVSNLSGSMTAAAEDVTQTAMQVARGESDEAYATKAQLASALNAIAAVATRFAGTNGGYIVINTDSNNQTTELLILCDAKTVGSAKQILRWNNQGLSYSGSGYSGTYTTLIDSNGKVNASALSSGVIKDAANRNSWNLATGAVAFSESATFGGKTMGEILNDAASISARDVVNALTRAELIEKLNDNGTEAGDNGIGVAGNQLVFAASHLSGILSDSSGNSWNLATGAVAFTANATVGGKTVDGRIEDKIDAYDTALNQQRVLQKLTSQGIDSGLYIGADGLLHMRTERVIDGGADIETVYLPTSLTNGVPGDYAEYTVRNGVIYEKEEEGE